MSTEPDGALEIAIAYHRAWTSGDMNSAVQYLAADVSCFAPAGTMTGQAEVRAFMEPFAESLTSSTLYAAYGSNDEAILMYDTANHFVPTAPGAELYRLRDGLIVEIRIIFDRLPFALARGDVVMKPGRSDMAPLGGSERGGP
ncbi:nuclear transport factor 2 family protein [Paenarthrobacter nicotinovorans]|uniref:nuclear transport factor 2 family protein n=1 Tax=Paenarthrobacter nicotinovorans TaxID=29320 RepID=UPI0004B6623C|nr:nuclear transport factor 2 family protein [Paenarthrobacter nicotinovorans]